MCGVTNLEYDHVEVLGETLGEIAWHKAGIFKVSPMAHHLHIIMIYNHYSLEYLHIQFHRKTKHCKSLSKEQKKLGYIMSVLFTIPQAI